MNYQALSNCDAHPSTEIIDSSPSPEQLVIGSQLLPYNDCRNPPHLVGTQIWDACLLDQEFGTIFLIHTFSQDQLGCKALLAAYFTS
jgi:hypothetical protein